MKDQPLFEPPVIDMSVSPTLAPKREILTESNPSVRIDGKGRAAAQRRAILEALRAGRVTATELAAMACQYNARIFELREAGYDIPNELDHATGVSTYTLRREPREVEPGVFSVTPRTRRAYRRRR